MDEINKIRFEREEREAAVTAEWFRLAAKDAFGQANNFVNSYMGMPVKVDPGMRPDERTPNIGVHVGGVAGAKWAEMVQLLRRREQQVHDLTLVSAQQQREYNAMHGRHLDVMHSRAQFARQVTRSAAILCWALPLLDRMAKLVTVLHEATESTGVHAECKAVLQACKEMPDVPIDATSAGEQARPGPATVGDARVSDGPDRSSGGGSGVPGCQLPGPAEGQAYGAVRPVVSKYTQRD